MEDLEVTAAELGSLLGIGERRVQQLAKAGVFERVSRGKYRLGACIQAYVATIEGRAEPDDLRQQRIGLLRAQRRRIELDNQRSEGSGADFAWQDAAIGALACEWYLRLRPVATWMYEALTKAGVANAQVPAGELQNWLIALRVEIEGDLKAAAVEARRREITITSYEDLLRVMGRAESEFDPLDVSDQG